MRRRSFIACSAAFVAAGMRAARAQQGSEGVKMPMLIENNRIYAYFEFPASDGRFERLLTNIDTGGGAVVLSRKAVDTLGLTGHQAGRMPPGMLALDLKDVRAGTIALPVPFAAMNSSQTGGFNPGASAPAFLPGAVLAPHVATFDYTGKALWIDGPPLEDGMPLIVGISKNTFPRVELEIDGERFGFLLDTGASFSMLSQTLIDRLHAKHPDWTYIAGAYGPANMIGKGDLASHMLRIPNARWGPFDLTLDVVSRANGTFEKYMSSMMSAPIVGAIAGNVLRNFTLRLDYRGGLLHGRYTPSPWPAEFAIVPLIVHAEKDGTYSIAGGDAAKGIAGAKIVAIDGYAVNGMSLFQVQDMLRGRPGTTHALSVGDGGKTRTVTLPVRSVF
jgi:Aspartyl protease